MEKYKLLSLISLLKSKISSKPWTFEGLIFGFIGSILLAFSVEYTDPWIPEPALHHMTIIQEYFMPGVFLLAVGFVFQIIGIIRDK